MKRYACMIWAVLLIAVSTSVACAYSGSLSAPGQLSGTGFWTTDPLNPTSYPGWFPASIAWNVTQNMTGDWHYNYTLSVYRAEISHFILETSPTFTSANYWGATGAFTNSSVNTFSSGPGNPSMPDNLYGIKFDSTTGTTLTLDFYSDRAPIWGDFYAKCGNVGGTQNTVWNNGFTNLVTDPLALASDGSVDNHILVPDTFDIVGTVPEPSSLMALGAGMVGILGLIRRRK